MKIYTKTGDKGQTSLYDGIRIDKDDIRVESYGTIDELNSYIGLCINYLQNKVEISELRKIQHQLFDIGGELATKDSNKYKNKISQQDIEYLEKLIDFYIEKIENNGGFKFIVPGTSLAASNLHIARTICRRAERRIITLSREEDINNLLIKYINRLSDFLYVLARINEKEIILMEF